MRQQYKLSKEHLEYYTKELKLTKNEISKKENISIETLKRYYKIYDVEEYHKCLYCRDENIANLYQQYQKDIYVIFNICISCKSKKITEGWSKRTPEQNKEFIDKRKKVNLEKYGVENSFNNEKAEKTRKINNEIRKEQTKLKKLQIKGKRKPYKHEKYKNKEIFYKEYIENNKTLYELKREWKCKEKSLLKYLKFHGFEEKYKCGNCGSFENLKKRQGNDSFKYYELCSVCSSLKNSKSQIKYNNERRSRLNITKEVLEDLHYNQFKNINNISKTLNIDKKYIKRLFKEFKIDEIIQCSHCGETDKNNLCIVNKKYINLCKKCKSELCINETTLKSYSKISQELFWGIYNKLPFDFKKETYFAELNREYSEKIDIETKEILEIKNIRYFYDFFIKHDDIKIVIEFFGDRFHANPELYEATDQPLLSFKSDKLASDIWEDDTKREYFILNQNYYFILVWEKDFKKNKNFWIDYCMIHINSLYDNLENIIKMKENGRI